MPRPWCILPRSRGRPACRPAMCSGRTWRRSTMSWRRPSSTARARLVYASSMSVLGYPFFVTPIAPLYLPIDSAHPVAPQDAYALSKWLGEEVVEAAVRRRPDLTAVSLRMPWIQTAATFPRDVAGRRAAGDARCSRSLGLSRCRAMRLRLSLRRWNDRSPATGGSSSAPPTPSWRPRPRRSSAPPIRTSAMKRRARRL